VRVVEIAASEDCTVLVEGDWIVHQLLNSSGVSSLVMVVHAETVPRVPYQLHLADILRVFIAARPRSALRAQSTLFSVDDLVEEFRPSLGRHLI
jgi:hypothetical protein